MYRATLLLVLLLSSAVLAGPLSVQDINSMAKVPLQTQEKTAAVVAPVQTSPPVVAQPQPQEIEAPPAPIQQPYIDPVLTPTWAANVALQDIKMFPAEKMAAIRYVWLRNGTKEELIALINAVNHSLNRVNVVLSLPDQVGPFGGAITTLAGGRIARLDLSLMVSDAVELENILQTWEKLLFIENDFIATIVGPPVITTVLVEVPRYKHTDGKFYTARREQVVSVPEPERVPAVHVLADMTKLREMTGSLVPIIDSREFNRAALTTLDGGLYYEFRGIKSDLKLSEYLARVGVSAEHVKLFADPSLALVSDTLSKAYIPVSGVTHKPRAVAVIPTANVRPTEGIGFASITFDTFNDNRDPNNNPRRNLSTFRGDGMEVIVTLPNGLHEFTLWNKDGQLVRVAPDNLVKDDRSLDGQLQPAISCIRCHAEEDGWRFFNNRIPIALKHGENIFGENDGQLDQTRNIELLAGMYSGDLFAPNIGALALGRLGYDRAIWRTTGIGAKATSDLQAKEFNSYYFEPLDVWAAATELGIVGLPPSDGDIKTKDDYEAARAAFASFFGGQITIDANGKPSNDGVVDDIIDGAETTRRDFELTKHLLYERLMKVKPGPQN